MSGPEPDSPAPTVAGSSAIWTAHPARERPGIAFAAGLVIVAAGAILSGVCGHPAWGVAAAGGLVWSLRAFFLSTRYRLDADGLHVTRLGTDVRLEWEAIRCFAYDDRGAFVSTRARRSWLDAATALHVDFGRESDRIVAHLKGCRAAGRSVLEDRRASGARPAVGTGAAVRSDVVPAEESTVGPRVEEAAACSG
jgi:hypothetical protein